MKKFLFSFFSFLACIAVHAQKPQFGMKAGLNIADAKASGTDVPNFTSLVGAHVGFFMDVKLGKQFSFQPEILYSTQGGQFKQEVFTGETIVNTSNKLKYAYINVPLMMKYYANPNFYLEFGPQIGFLTNSELEVSFDGQTVGQDFMEYSTKTDFALNLGLGYEVTKKVVISGRYGFGLTNTLDTEPGDNSELLNQVFLFSIGYKFK